MNPKHQNPTYYRENSRGNTFEAVAPYNFVPLPEQIHAVDLPESCDLDRYSDTESQTGYIDCTFTTMTPLYTRTAMTPQFYEQWGEKIRELMKNPSARQEYAQFFHGDQGKQPVIPGSSLRGMVRTLVEIISNSKMKWVTNEPLVFRSVGDRTGLGEYYRTRLMIEGPRNHLTPKVIAGYIEKVGYRWYIRPAQSVGGSTFARVHRNDLKDVERLLAQWHSCKNAWKLWVKTGSLAFQNLQGGYRKLKYMPVTEVSATAKSGFAEAVLVKSGFMNNKRRESVFFPPDANAPLLEIDEELIRRYREQVSQEQMKLLGEHGMLREQQPVFYLLDQEGKLAFCGHTMMLRLPYEKTPLDFVPAELRSSTITDLTEAIFGFVAEDKGDERKPRAGRVSFCDAQLAAGQENIWLAAQAITPRIMSGPKPTSFQHYLTQQEPDTVDTWERTKAGESKTATLLDHYASPPPHQTVIRGHKLYWHKAGTDQAAIEAEEKVDFVGDAQQRPPKLPDTQHTQIKPVRAGVTFHFRLHFENLRDFELGALLWALALPGEESKQYCHKLGMGKALGMGSIQMAVAALKISQRKERYATLFADDGWHLPEEEQTDRLSEYINAFVGRIRGQAGGALHDDERIRMLLRLLEYPGQNPERTRYMALEEFRERPVLPDPLHITQRFGRGLAFPLTALPGLEEDSAPVAPIAMYSTDEAERGPSEEGQALLVKLNQRLTGAITTTDKSPLMASTNTELVAKIPESKDGFVPGAYIQVTVRDVQFTGITCDTGVKEVQATLTTERIMPPITETGELAKRFTVGQQLNVWVLNINRKGRVQVTMRKPN